MVFKVIWDCFHFPGEEEKSVKMHTGSFHGPRLEVVHIASTHI